MDGWTDGRTDGWIDAQTDGWMNKNGDKDGAFQESGAEAAALKKHYNI